MSQGPGAMRRGLFVAEFSSLGRMVKTARRDECERRVNFCRPAQIF